MADIVPDGAPALVQADDVRVHYKAASHRGTERVRAVDGVSLEITRGETLGLVGESGCGKSTLGRALIGLRPPTSGRVLLDGRPIGRRRSHWRATRRRLQIVFQDPYGSLDPRMTIGAALAEPLRLHGFADRHTVKDAVSTALEGVGLSAAMAGRYPHEFSGGQRQRVAIARAMTTQPEFVFCDEPVSALDVSVQAQILNLFLDLRERHSLTYLFVSHDLAVVRRMSTRVGVMYLGKVVEIAGTADLYARPAHPYTQALLSAVPEADVEAPTRRNRIVLSGDMPSPSKPPTGCSFHTRCPLYRALGRPALCVEEAPETVEVAPGHQVSCHFHREAADQTYLEDSLAGGVPA